MKSLQARILKALEIKKDISKKNQDDFISFINRHKI